jgi:hypothetical protein
MKSRAKQWFFSKEFRPNDAKVQLTALTFHTKMFKPVLMGSYSAGNLQTFIFSLKPRVVQIA